MNLEQKHKLQDASRIGQQLTKVAPFFINDGIEWKFDKDQTAGNLHNILSGALLEIGIQAEVSIKIGRGKYSKGNQYATVTVTTKSIVEQPNPAVVLEQKILETYGNAVKVSERPNGVIIEVKSVQTAQKFLKMLRRFKVQILADDYLNYRVFVPVKPELLLAE